MRPRRDPDLNAVNVTVKGRGGDARHVLVGECFVGGAAEISIVIFLSIELMDGMGNIFTPEHCGR